MPEHDFSALYQCYPTVIGKMQPEFTSHEFILRLAQQNQKLYIEALYAYRDVPRADGQAPFMMVHGILAKHLHDCPEVEFMGNVSSTDIFGQSSTCAKWRQR